MFWNKELTYWITPKSGPMRGMATLIDANHALYALTGRMANKRQRSRHQHAR